MSDQFPDWADADLSQRLPRLVGAGETQAVEFKREMPKHVADLAKEIAAFSTSNDGVILLGVADDGEIVGIPDGEQEGVRRALRERLAGIFDLVRPTATPSISFTLFDSFVVLAISVRKGDQPVYYSAHTPYQRNLSSSRPMPPEDVIAAILAWSAAKNPEPSPEAKFLMRLATFWAEAELVVSDCRSREIDPWWSQARREAAFAAKHARRLAAEAPHALEAVIDPLEKLADAFSVIASEEPTMGALDEDAADAMQNADDIVARIKALHLGPDVFNGKAAADQRAKVIADARLLQNLARRIDANGDAMSDEDIKSETNARGLSLYFAASIGVGVGDENERKALLDIAAALRDVDLMDIEIDGGVSFGRLLDRVRELNTALQAWVRALESRAA